MLWIETLDESIDVSQTLCVREIEHLPTYLQLVAFAPGHCECLSHSHVNIDVAWIAKNVSVATFTRLTTPEALIHSCRIREEICRMRGIAATSRTFRYLCYTRDIIAAIPIRGPTAK